ncbi:uncharacterized protein (UPF0335 family) [Methylobacterium sp. B4]|nr:uncharacterized protein (UPF0335 family) [Methylobacterium sp. B4]
MSDTTDTVGVAGDRIRSIIERIERLDEEIKDLMETKKEIFGEAKGEGLDVKVLKEILKLRKQDKDERDERESLLEVYVRAMDAPAPLACPHRTSAREPARYGPAPWDRPSASLKAQEPETWLPATTRACPTSAKAPS